MTTRAVHWHEGMFLRPQHFQAAVRHLADQTSRGLHWDLHHNWGLRRIEIDLDALANYRFVVRAMEVRLRDGTVVSVPEDCLLPELDLKDAFGERAGSVTVYVGLPVMHL